MNGVKSRSTMLLMILLPKIEFGKFDEYETATIHKKWTYYGFI